MLLEYLESGRCHTLTGAEGAYNIYERELMAHIITDKLDQILKSLEDIKKGQFILYSSLTQVNKRLSKMAGYTEKIIRLTGDIKNANEIAAYNSEKTAYYSKVAANNTAITAFLEMWNNK